MSRYINRKLKSIGVELTGVINPELKAAESAREKIVRIAREKFRNQIKDKLVVYVDFDTHAPQVFKPVEIESVAQSLFELIHKISCNNLPYEFRVEASGDSIHHMFRSVTVSNENGYENWQPFGSFKVPHIDTSWFIEIIRNKEGKIPSYQESFDEKWLVLTANFGSRSSYYQFSQLKHDFSASPFDKIYVYKYMEDEVIILK